MNIEWFPEKIGQGKWAMLLDHERLPTHSKFKFGTMIDDLEWKLDMSEYKDRLRIENNDEDD